VRKIAVVVALLVGVGAWAQAPVAVVNGEPISREELDRATRLSEIVFTLYQEYPEFTQALLMSEEGKAFLARYEREVLDRLILRKLQLQEARARGIVANEEQVTEEVDRTIQQIMAYYGLSADDLAQILAMQGMTVDDFRAEIAQQVREKLVLDALKRAVRDEAVVSEEEIAAFYEKNLESFTGEDGSPKPLDEVREDIITQLLPSKREAYWSQWLKDLRANADVVINL